MLRVALTLSILSIFFSGCSTDNSSALDATTYGDSTATTVKAIFTRSCSASGCHGFQGSSADDLANQGFIVKGDPLNSKIYFHLIGSTGSNGPKDMPLSGAPLSAGDIAAIQTWIAGLQ